MRLLLLTLLTLAGCSAAVEQTSGAADNARTAESPTASAESAPDPHGLMGKAAPEFEVSSWLRGGPHSLASLRGRAVLVRFFTNTCPFCASSMPALQTLHEEFGEQGLVVLGLYHPKPRGVRRPYEDVEKLLDAWEVTFDVATDDDWATLDRWWLAARSRRATSAAFLVDREGRIRHIHPGPELHPAGMDCNLEARACARDFDALRDAIREVIR